MKKEQTSFFTDRARIYAFILILVFGFSIYSNSLRNSFHLDDDIFIIHNISIRNIWNWPAIWQNFNSRFITGLSFAFNYDIGGLNVFGYHMVNLLIHIANAFLIFFFVRHLYQTPYFVHHKRQPAGNPTVLALLTALVFLAHPVQSQAVNYISQRAASLAVLFYFLALVFYLKWFRYYHRQYYAAALVSAVCAMLSKELAFTLPLAVIFTDVFFLKSKYESLLTITKRLFPFLLTWLIIPLSLLAERSQSIVDLKEQLAATQFNVLNLLTAVNVLRTYMRLCLFPVHLNLDYDYPRAQGLLEGSTLISLALITVVFFFGVYQFRRRRILSFSVLWFFTAIMMEFASSAYVGRDMIFEHWLYLALFGFALFLAVGLKVFVRNRYIYYGLMAVLLFGYGTLTYQRNKVWKDPITLWTDVLRKSPQKVRSYDNLAAAYIDKGNFKGAKQLLIHALRLDPESFKSFNNLGLIYLEEKDMPRASEHFEKSVEINPEFAEGWSNLGVLYLRTGQYEKAAENLARALTLNPNLIETKRTLGVVCQQRGDFPQAIQLYQEILARDPHEEESLYNLTELYLDAGIKVSAVETAQRVIERGTNVRRLTGLGSRFAEKNIPQTALDFFQKSLEVDPDYPDTYIELGKFYGNRNDFQRAIAIWQEGLTHAPEDQRFIESITKADVLLHRDK